MTSKPCSRSDTSALILAGGKATRLGGVDKLALVIEGRSIFERLRDVLAPRVAEIVVASPRPMPGHRTVADVVAGAGPLAGIAAGLDAVTTDWLLVVAGDMPHLTGAIVDAVLARADATHDAVGIRIGGLPEPLVCALRVAVYRPIVARRLAARALKASQLLEDEPVRIAWLIDPELRAFFNVNAPEDL